MSDRDCPQSSKHNNADTGVLLFHGLTGMPSEMRPLEKHLIQKGYTVKSPLLAGHGAGHQELLATSWTDWMDKAREDLDELASRCKKVFVGGLSMGASISTVLAAEDKRVSGLFLLSTTLRYDGPDTPATQVFIPFTHILPVLRTHCYWSEKPPYGLKDKRLQRIITRSIEAAKNGETGDFGLFRTYGGSLRQMTILASCVRKKAEKVKCPTLVVHSLEDTITSIDNATEIYARIGSKDKSIVLLTGCDHVLTLDLKRKEVAANVSDFVERVSAGKRKDGRKWAVA